MKKQAWIGIGLLGAGGLAWYFNNQINLAKKLCVKPTTYVLKQLSGQGIVVTLYYEVKNLGAFSIDVKRYNFNILANGQYLATAMTGQPFTIEPYQKTEASVDIVITPQILVQSVGNVLAGMNNWKNIKMTIDGSVSLRKYGLPFKVPVSYDFTLEELTGSSSSESSC